MCLVVWGILAEELFISHTNIALMKMKMYPDEQSIDVGVRFKKMQYSTKPVPTILGTSAYEEASQSA